MFEGEVEVGKKFDCEQGVVHEICRIWKHLFLVVTSENTKTSFPQASVWLPVQSSLCQLLCHWPQL